jgi:hypothetical protein
MSTLRHSREEIVERGQALYDRDVRDKIEQTRRGEFLALDIETGDYEIDPDEVEALKRVRERNIDGEFYVLRIGFPTAFRLGSSASVSER